MTCLNRQEVLPAQSHPSLVREPNPKIHRAGHPHIGRRVLEMTRLTVDQNDRNPELVQIGIDNLER